MTSLPSLPSDLPFEGIVFDLDGTLIDSVPDLALALNALLREEGLPPVEPAQVPGFVGQGARILVGKAMTAVGRPVADEGAGAAELDRLHDRFVALYEAKPVEGTRPYDGAEAFLRALHARGVRLGVCTNKPHGATLGVLEALGLAALFDAVVGAGLIPERKPDPAPLRLALERMGIAPEQAVMVGDTPYDVGAARAAGVRTILVDFGYSPVPPAEVGADILVSSYAEMPAALARLRSVTKPA
ncbi:phosphoglycolate phosphatase [Roseospira marina]|uniref:Phosphoglycolate phosphatase n=1 Tax=Roseospira marina TaxID=140057 RepID=A0A5M6IG93_9PROT|nr:phosphoglycolate phosphatase [Roseospira marina]KAA5607341.1 phosphoglycolate phosphatase [Roseospira marina]MBB4312496.1 phosphoglycolate phosphatase [Roseospira marina]MBB5085488.1 phosphoglycolate phosphatase [Roseospira marina]